MAQTFLPGMTNRNTGVSRREIQVFDPQAWQSRLRRDTWQVYFRGSPVRKSNSATRVPLSLCTLQQHVESNLGKNQTQPKILIAFLLPCMPFFTAAILLCAVRDAQCRTSSRARKKSRAVIPGQVDFLAARGNCPYGSKKWPRARKCESCSP